MAALDGADGGASCARRCRELFTTHHSANKARRVDDAKTQTEERIQQRTVEQIVQSPMQRVVIPQERNSERIKNTPSARDQVCGARPCHCQKTAHAAPDPVTECVASSAELDGIALLAETWNDNLDPEVCAKLVQANVRAHLSFGKEKGKSDRGQQLRELRERTECNACGRKGHWAHDYECAMYELLLV